MINRIIGMIIMGMLLFSCNSSSNDTTEDWEDLENWDVNSPNDFDENNNPEVLRETLKDTEARNPTDYLIVTYDVNTKILSGKDVIKGSITNLASVATFKDVSLRVNCFSKTNTLLNSYDYVVYEYVFPNDYVPFEIKLHSPNGTRTIGVEVIGAKLE